MCFTECICCQYLAAPSYLRQLQTVCGWWSMLRSCKYYSQYECSVTHAAQTRRHVLNSRSGQDKRQSAAFYIQFPGRLRTENASVPSGSRALPDTRRQNTELQLFFITFMIAVDSVETM